MLQSVVPVAASGSEAEIRAEIRAEMERILRSRTFVHSHRIRPFLIAGPVFDALRTERPYAALQAAMGLAAPVASAA